jgi:UDPglucose 6-dehydrogenase
MRGKVVVDLRNVFDPEAMREAGFAYHGIGRAKQGTTSDATASDQG